MIGPATITGLGSWLPPRTVTNHDLAAAGLETSDEWIRQRTGIAERHVVDPGSATSDLAVRAGQLALKSAGTDDVDLLILATTTPDHPCPATAPDVADRLGQSRIIAFDVSAVCSGFLYALVTASALVGAGQARRALVIGAESFSTLLDPADRTNRAIFGDGAGAVVLEAAPQAGTRRPGALLGIDLASDGSLKDLITVPGGGSRQRSGPQPADPAQNYFRMEGKQVFMKAVTLMADSCRRAVAKAGWELDAVDRVVPHQANQRIIDAVADRLHIDRGKAISNIEKVGNTAAASIPIALADACADGRLRPGHRTVLTAFGGGATWGALALEWPDIDLV